MAKRKETGVIEVANMQTETLGLWLKGRTPLICNRLSKKVWDVLLQGAGKKTATEKKQQLKHDPVAEFLDSMDRRISTAGPTRLLFPASAIKGAICTAALDTPGVTRTMIGRLVHVDGSLLDLYGVPKLHMAAVRSADMNKTPDIRTRSILAEWCIPVNVTYVTPTLNKTVVTQLLCNGGITCGIGDFRPEKGKGNYGQFTVVNKDDVRDIVKSGGIKQQDKALADIEFYDDQTREAFERWEAYVESSGKGAQRRRTTA